MGNTEKVKGGLERRKESKWWYGRFQIDGKRKVKNLRVEIRGTPPRDNEEFGSVQFECSKAEAETALKVMLAEINSNKSAEDLAQAVHEVRTGHKVVSYTIADLPQLWDSMPRNKPPTEEHRKQCHSILKGFALWMTEQASGMKRLEMVTADLATAYMKREAERGIAPRTWNFILGTLKAACRRGGSTAFNDIRQKPLDTVHRIPFTPEELADVLEAAKADDLLYPLVLTASCTAMRKGDCCRLKWEAVDLKSGFITVKTSKTGRMVDIPLADLLRDEIKRHIGNGSEYIFPRLAKQYDSDAGLLTKHFKLILAQAGFHDGKAPPQELAPYDPQELEQKAETYFEGIPTEKKRTKARAMFTHYTAGTPLCQSAEIVGISKGTASTYLNEIERETGIAFIRGKKRKPTAKTKPSRGNTVKERETGLLKASVRDFHALRTTWITLALMQGLPLELVQTVTGHATAEIVMEHYFKPQREQLKTALQKCLPSMLTSGTKQPCSQTEKAIEQLETMTADNWEGIKAKALEILRKEVCA